MTDISIFGENPLRITKKIRLIELFAGYGSQALALRYLKVPFEHYAISEWAVKSIQAYKDMHFPYDDFPYDAGFSDTQVREFLYGRISKDYSTPLSDEKIDKMPIREARAIVNNMVATNNFGSITKLTADDLPLLDRDEFTYVMTYSFPCQDLSLAGAQKGMLRDSGTRSSLLWEVERLLHEWNAAGTLPDVLLMENVPQVCGTKNKDNWNDWLESLSMLGYSNYYNIVNAVEYGIPQSRKRCFMVSCLNSQTYEFPEPIGCDIRLKHVLQKDVDESYYLSDDQVENFVRSQPVNVERERERELTQSGAEDMEASTDIHGTWSLSKIHPPKPIDNAITLTATEYKVTKVLRNQESNIVSENDKTSAKDDSRGENT